MVVKPNCFHNPQTTLVDRNGKDKVWNKSVELKKYPYGQVGDSVPVRSLIRMMIPCCFLSRRWLEEEV